MSEQTKSGHNGDHNQGADDHECIPDGERQDAGENWTVADTCRVLHLCQSDVSPL